jgi:flagellar basal body rod protein FlgC
MFRALGIAASGMSAQRTRIDVAASNLANADVTRGADGKAYNRRIVQLRTATQNEHEASFRFPNQLPFTTAPFGTSQFDVPAGAASSSPPGSDDPNFGVTVDSIQEDTTPGARVHIRMRMPRVTSRCRTSVARRSWSIYWMRGVCLKPMPRCSSRPSSCCASRWISDHAARTAHGPVAVAHWRAAGSVSSS